MMKTRNTFVLSLLALALILSAVISPALAYFTDQDQATGAIPITLSGKTVIQDNYENGKKTIAIQNTKGRDVWVRMQIAVGETVKQYVVFTSGTGWTDGGDGYWYYGSPVSSSAPNNSTSIFTVDITNVPVPIPTENQELSQTEFNVSVLYETTPVQYNTDGSTKAADWNIQLKP